MDKTTILFVDDEKRIVRILAILFQSEEKYNVLTATSAKDALALFDQHEIHIVVSDQRMPEMKGVEFLGKVQKKSPSTIRMLLTGYADRDAIISSINEGEVYRYISKPWENDKLLETVGNAAKLAKLVFNPTNQVNSVKPDNEINTTTSTKLLSTDDYGILVLDSGKNEISNIIKGIFINNPVYTISSIKKITSLLSNARHSKKDISVIVVELNEDRDELVSTVKMIKQANPVVLCIVVTAYADSEIAISLINEGQIFRYLPLPVNAGRLKRSIASALSFTEQLKKNSNHLKCLEVDNAVDKNDGESDSLFSKIQRRIFTR